ncbi:MAG: hypothetical protein ACXWJB_03990 [Limisphaerales bacterium]
MKSVVVPRSFKPWPENNARLEYAKLLGIDISKMVNELVRDHGKPYLEKQKASKAKAIKDALEAPVP